MKMYFLIISRLFSEIQREEEIIRLKVDWGKFYGIADEVNCHEIDF